MKINSIYADDSTVFSKIKSTDDPKASTTSLNREGDILTIKVQGYDNIKEKDSNQA